MWHVINLLIWYGNVNNPLKLCFKSLKKLIFRLWVDDDEDTGDGSGKNLSFHFFFSKLDFDRLDDNWKSFGQVEQEIKESSP